MLWEITLVGGLIGIVLIIGISCYVCIYRFRHASVNIMDEANPLLSTTEHQLFYSSSLTPILEENVHQNSMKLDENWATSVAMEYIQASKTYHWLHQYLRNIGSRKEKWYFLVHDCEHQPKKPCLLSLLPFPDQQLFMMRKNNVVLMIYSLIMALEGQPRLLTISEFDIVSSKTTGDAIATIVPFYPKGSLKDFICHRGNRNSVLMPCKDKYGRNSKGKPLAQSMISKIGREILLGIKTLNNAGIPCYHLSSSNVILTADSAVLTNFENLLLGLLPNPKILAIVNALQDCASTEMILFGMIVFEMALGTEISLSMITNGVLLYRDLKRPPAQVQHVLDAIFQQTIPSEVLTVDYLLQMPLFNLSKDSSLDPIHITTQQQAFIAQCVAVYHAQLQELKTKNIRKRKGFSPSKTLPTTTSLALQKKRARSYGEEV